MTNKEVSTVFTDIYNVFWMKHRDSLPALHNEAEWDAIYAEAENLKKKHDCQLAWDMVENLIIVMDQRARECEKDG